MRTLTKAIVLAGLTMSSATAVLADMRKQRQHEIDTGDDDSGITRLVCGPASVRYILQLRGIDVPLDQLIRELQWPMFEQGASVSDIAHALEARGVRTLPIRLNRVETLRWHHPAILHYKDDSDERNGGHFVVLLSLTQRDALIWDSFGSPKRVPLADVRDRMSGVILLTAPSSIDRFDAFFAVSATHLEGSLVLSACTLALICVLLLWRSPIQTSHSNSLPNGRNLANAMPL